MPISAYLRDLRAKIGNSLVILPSAAGIVRDDRGRLLLLRSKDSGEWTIPGGAVDPGEHPAQALVREVWEEAGVKVRPTGIAAVLGGPAHRLHYPNGDVAEYVVTVFHAEVVGGAPPPPTPRDGEALEVGFFDAAEVAARAGPALAALLSPGFAWDEAWLDLLD